MEARHLSNSDQNIDMNTTFSIPGRHINETVVGYEFDQEGRGSEMYFNITLALLLIVILFLSISSFIGVCGLGNEDEIVTKWELRRASEKHIGQ